MNIKELKTLVKNLPDDMPVLECFSGAMHFGVAEPNIQVRTVFTSKGKYGKEISFIESFSNEDVINQYEAFVFYTEE